jgi:glutaredoxin
MKVTIYSTPSCHNCKDAKAYFDAHAIDYTEADATKFIPHIVEKSGKRQVPFIEVGDGNMTGWDEETFKGLYNK